MGKEFGGEVQKEGETFNPDTDKWGSGLLGYGVFPGGSAGKESTCNVGDLDSIPELGRSPREGKGYPLQYPGLENSMDCIVHGATKSRTQLSDLHSLSKSH